MLRRILCALFVCLAPVAAAVADPVIDGKLQFSGRWDRRKPDRAITVNSGSHVVARFEAGAITARFDMTRNKPPMPTIAWKFDDDAQWRESEIAAAVELGKDLKPGSHTLWLFVRGMDEHQPRWAEPLTASVTFLGLELSQGGKFLEPPPEPKLKIEFLGDSITEGVRVHPKEPGRETWAWKTDGLQAWPAQTALRLKAQWRQVGFGAVGVTRSGSGGVPPAPDSFDWFYEGCPRDDWQPNVVVINHGTNDHGVTAEQFRPAFATYLARIRKAYPQAKMLVLRPFAGTHAKDIQAEVEAFSDAGDRNVRFIDTVGWLERSDFTDGVHPNAGAGPKVAERLSKIVAEQP